MKKLLLSISATLAGTFAMAQCTMHYAGETTDISGTTVYLAAAPSSDNFVEVIITNTSGMEKLWKIRRVRLDTPPSGWLDWVCLGVEEDPLGGICYSNSNNNPWTTPDPAQHYVNGDPAGGIGNGESAKASFHVNPGEMNGGTAHYRYYVMQDGGGYEDSLDVIANGTLSVKDPKEAISVNVFPNPASGVLTINAQGLEGFTVRITDVLGKVVYSDEGVTPKKIDVSEFRNGVYIVAVMQKGTAVHTKRIVVKH
jgi:hypothetical protein